MTSTTSSAVVNVFKEYICYMSVLQITPQFSVDDFAKFARAYGFSHVMSSPHKPHDTFIALMAYMAIPLAATGDRPSQLLMGRSMCQQYSVILLPRTRHSSRRLTDIPVGSAVSVRTPATARCSPPLCERPVYHMFEWYQWIGCTQRGMARDCHQRQ